MRDRLLGRGYRAIGMDHYAAPVASISQRADRGELRRSFQGHTTDDAETLIRLPLFAYWKA